MGHELASVPSEHAEQVELDRREVHGLPVARDLARLEVDLQLPDAHSRLTLLTHPAQRSPKTSEELVGPERLRDVVVGSGVQGPDLLSLVADRREHDDRQAAPAADLLADLHSRPVREDQVEHHRVRGPHGDGVERLLLGLGLLGGVPGAPQDHLERADDLRLVVDDQHPPGVGAHRTSTGWATSGNATANVAPSPPPCRLISPPFASTSPRQMARPSPDPWCGSVPRTNGSKISLRLEAAMPGPE